MRDENEGVECRVKMELGGSKELRELMLRFSFPRPRVSPPSTPDPLPSVEVTKGSQGGKMSDPRYPSLYQINTRVWLTELSRALGKHATLDDITDAELDRLAALGFDWIWFLSVWQTGPAAQQMSRSNAGWRKEFARNAAGSQRRRHRRLRLRHSKLHRASRSRRRRRARTFAPAAATTRTEIDARLCPQSHGPGSPVER